MKTLDKKKFQHPNSLQGYESKLRYKKKTILQKLDKNTLSQEKKLNLNNLHIPALSNCKRPFYLNSHVLINYVRYADDWIIGVNGPKSVASKIKEQIEIKEQIN